METAGANVEEEELREALKANGIGRPSTRAAIIEVLYRRGYIESKRKSIRATEAGINLIATIRDELLKSAKLTGIWEGKLRQIERGSYDAKTFLDQLKTMVKELSLTVLRDNSNIRIEAQQAPQKTAKPAAKKPDNQKSK